MKKALSPAMKTLVTNELLRHTDVDVNVSVASCISEITRITAPDAPYEDEEMKEVFQLFLSAFENLDDKSSPSYFKRTSILETVAKVRSCVVMLDLECDELIAKMFQHFFKSIRMEWKNQKKNPARGRRKGEVGRGKRKAPQYNDGSLKGESMHLASPNGISMVEWMDGKLAVQDQQLLMWHKEDNGNISSSLQENETPVSFCLFPAEKVVQRVIQQPNQGIDEHLI